MAKQWSWSYSKFKNYFTCPKRHYEIDIAKHYNESSEQLDWGNAVHAALAKAVQGEKLPDSMADYQHWVDEITTGVFRDRETSEPVTTPSWIKYLSSPGATTAVEKKFAITKDFQPTEWFGHNAWFRGILDVGRFDPTGTVGLARDYKTGKVLHDSRQLMLMTTCIFAHMPKLKRLRTEFVWLKDDCVTSETFDRVSIMNEWPPVLAGVTEMVEADKSLNYPPKPSRLCARYCPVISCPYHGKRH